MKILVKITKEVLERSKMCGFGETVDYTRNCAVAVALHELGKLKVRSSYILWSTIERTILSDFVMDFIDRFDNLKPQARVNLPEFSFEIDLPESVIEAIGIDQVYKILSESKTLEHVNP